MLFDVDKHAIEKQVQSEFASLQMRQELLDELKSIRFRLDDIVSDVKSECITCLEHKRKARKHQLLYKAGLIDK